METKPKVNRRNFLKTAGIVLAGTGLTCAGLGALGTMQPAVEKPELNLKGTNPMNKKALIVYATKAGSTAEVARFIGQALNDKGISVDIQPADKAGSVEGYDAVIAGSAIRMGSWVAEAKDFLKRNQSALATVPTACFSVGIPEGRDAQGVAAALEKYMLAVKEIVQPVDSALFLGKMDTSKLSFFDGLITKAMKAKDEDLRDWNVIRSWSESLPATLKL